MDELWIYFSRVFSLVRSIFKRMFEMMWLLLDEQHQVLNWKKLNTTHTQADNQQICISSNYIVFFNHLFSPPGKLVRNYNPRYYLCVSTISFFLFFCCEKWSLSLICTGSTIIIIIITDQSFHDWTSWTFFVAVLEAVIYLVWSVVDLSWMLFLCLLNFVSTWSNERERIKQSDERLQTIEWKKQFQTDNCFSSSIYLCFLLVFISFILSPFYCVCLCVWLLFFYL